ncbi:MAG TPA: hypothetical protein VIV40_38190 [Kofleriaceae bacterium]
MNARIFALVAVTACHDNGAHAPASLAPAPVPFVVAFERLLPSPDQNHAPLFGPDGSITVGATRWQRDGKRGPRNQWAQSGQLRPIASVGTAADPVMLAIAWSGFEIAKRPALTDDETWLVAGAPDATTPNAAIATRLPFSTDWHADVPNAIELAPGRAAFVAAEGDALVVRAVAPLGTALARVALTAEDGHHACWVDDGHVAWREQSGMFATLDIARGTIARMPAPAGRLVACDPGGGSAALATDGRIQIVDLATGGARGAIAADNAKLVAIADHGCELAMLSRRIVSVYRCTDLGWYRPLFVRATARPPRWIAFSPDGATLAFVGASLVVMRAGAVERPPPPLPTLAELPRGFTPRPPTLADEHEPWGYAQLALPMGIGALPAVLVDAQDEHDIAEVRTIAMPREAVSVAAPAPDADDATLRTYALRAMPELFDSWRDATVESDRDAQYTLRVGRRDGKPWFETRELWRDGCEPYDGYTQVVIDRDLLFITRVLVPPHGSTSPWLQTFYDLPFEHRTHVARRRGPDSGPC